VSRALFLVISGLGLVAALGTVLARNLVHAALFLVAFFFIVSCQFVMLEAEFLAAIQVLVYIGAVAILMMFGIMLTRNVQGDDTMSVPKGGWVVPGLVVSLGLFVILTFGINNHVGLRNRSDWGSSVHRSPSAGDSPQARAINNMGKAVGDQMMTRYALPFEVAGLLLTAALVGAIALAHKEDDGDSPRKPTAATRAGRSGGNGVKSGSEPVPATVSGRPERV
jgi:NADH-quinone oxidoreductase subunit J